eukprot:TRINITY_DN16002_c0_g1_i1.p1 TRINITY_DN16002_c0_g1~~TRINITY_DN16002_c0_g1_i1.p1  ORF type:complete len:462 (+),score=82.14 TRINITY_DN16002_c0_g1_i1:44-1429(+)
MVTADKCGVEWESALRESDYAGLVSIFRTIVVNLLRNKPPKPMPYITEHIDCWLHDYEDTQMDFNNYNWRQPSSELYTTPGPGETVGEYASVRSGLDSQYHGSYIPERQRLQDVRVKDVIGAGVPKEHPWLVFTAGAMGAGKSHCVRWMCDNGYFPLPDIVQIDPDRFKERLPEWEGYLHHDPLSAGSMLRKESGYLVEIAQEVALGMKKNTWVDGSLRDGEWYKSQFERIKLEHPEYRIAIIHVTAPLETVIQRALSRGESTGRHVPESEIRDSFERVPKVVEMLTPQCDFVAHINNTDDGDPVLLKYVDESGDTVTDCNWAAVKSRFTTDPELASVRVDDWTDQVAQMLASNRLVLFTKSYCSFCKTLKGLLCKLNIDYYPVELDTMGPGGLAIQLVLGRMTSVRTVPLLFLKGSLLGTCESILQMHKDGKLLSILNEDIPREYNPIPISKQPVIVSSH